MTIGSNFTSCRFDLSGAMTVSSVLPRRPHRALNAASTGTSPAKTSQLTATIFAMAFVLPSTLTRTLRPPSQRRAGVKISCYGLIGGLGAGDRARSVVPLFGR
jgi:hypothetical protein